MSAFINQHDVIDSLRAWAIDYANTTLPDDLKTDTPNLVRFHIEGDKSGSLNGAYKIHTNDRPSAYLENHKSGFKGTWSYNDPDYKPVQLTPEQRKQQTEQIRQNNELREKELANKHAAAAEKALFIWNKSKPLTDNESHTYLVKKGIKGVYSIRVNHYQGNTSLVIPVGKDGAFSTLQFINPDGSKTFLTGGKKSGCYSILNKMEHPRYVAIGEGFATVASVIEDKSIIEHRAGFMGVMALDAGNLEAVAVAMREKYPTADILIFGDIGDTDNKGEKSARAAAKLVNGYCVLPPMVKGDFNDYLTGGNITTSLDDLITAAVNEAYEASETDSAEFLNVEGHTNNDDSNLNDCPDFPSLEGELMPRSSLSEQLNDIANHQNELALRLNYEGDIVTNAALENAAPTTAKIKELTDHQAALLNSVYDKPEKLPAGQLGQTGQTGQIDVLKWSSGDDLADNAKAPDYLINDILEADSHGILLGASMTFKSFLALELAHCICTGSAFFEHEVFATGKVLYICGEGRGALERRIKALKIVKGGFNNNLMVLDTPINIDGSVNMASLSELINTHTPYLVIFDTFGSLNGGTNENDNSEVGKVLNLVKETCRNGKTSSLIVHHLGKDENRGGRGAVSFKTNVDFLFDMRRTPDTMTATLSCVKMKDGDNFADIYMNAHVVELGLIRQDGKVTTSLILQPTTAPPPKEKTLSPDCLNVLNSLNELLDDDGIDPPPNIKALFPDSPQNRPKKVVTIEQWKKYAIESLSSVKGRGDRTHDARRKAFDRATILLFDSGKAAESGGYAWIAYTN